MLVEPRISKDYFVLFTVREKKLDCFLVETILPEPVGSPSIVHSFMAQGSLVMRNLSHVAVVMFIMFPADPQSINAVRTRDSPKESDVALGHSSSKDPHSICTDAQWG